MRSSGAKEEWLVAELMSEMGPQEMFLVGKIAKEGTLGNRNT